ncbi:type I DNA topoisomerase [bacterium]|jgi:DNA topoisomerase-1|nr:type I DNA topoisomerase [bacterium]
MKSLVIVESPAKAKTINKILGKDFEVMACEGHVRDLPEKEIGVDIEKKFKPKYVTIQRKKTVVSKIRKAAEKSGKIFLAPDPDREGEAIAWHLSEVIKAAADKVKRVTFNEITSSAVKKAFDSAHEIDMKKVNSQQARRILDRIVGYKISPILWKKIRGSQSAGRVQSVALRLICEKESEIDKFTSVKYWDIFAELKKLEGEANSFRAKLISIDSRKVVQDKKNEGEISIESEKQAEKIKEELDKTDFLISKISRRNISKSPPPPFTTSILQQVGVNYLGWSIKKVMDVAQSLYEGLDIPGEGHVGLITYMRTDSVRISDDAVQDARRYIKENFKDSYLPDQPRRYKTKKTSQDAHEAIRPTSVFMTPERLQNALNADQNKLYRVIWQRFVACQMSQSEIATTSVDIRADKYLFRASGSIIIFDGFRKVYSLSSAKKKVNSERDDLSDENNGEDSVILPEMEEGERLKLLNIDSKEMNTKPPARYSEATLVKTLEEKGIGRPSTYVPIIQTIMRRQYVLKEKSRLLPTELGKVINDMLVSAFPEIINYDFTARMENELDDIEEGKEDWVKVLDDFYAPFKKALSLASEKMTEVKKEVTKTDKICPECGKKGVTAYLVKRFGKSGEFLGCENFSSEDASIHCTYTEPLGNGSKEIKLPELKEEVKCDKCGKQMVVKMGRYGPFIACSDFPNCKNTKPLPTGKKCPKCGGKIIQKRFKGRFFYGCGNYPDCTFSAKNLEDIK